MEAEHSSAVAFPTEASSGSWFAACCRPHQEDLAKLHLERQAYDVYLPKLKIGRRHGTAGWAEVIEPLFPRYLFVHFNPTEKSAAPIRSTRGVVGLVRFGSGDPAIVPDLAIDALKARENSSGLHVDKSARLSKGDKVHLLDGPFRGMIGSFEESDGQKRVILLLEAIGLNRITVSRAWVARVTA